MTYIQPNKKSLINRILLILIVGAVFAALWLVVLYNGTVNLEYGIIGMRAEFKEAQIENAQLQERMLGLFDPSNFEEIIGSGLIQDKNPEYVEIGLGREAVVLGLRN